MVFSCHDKDPYECQEKQKLASSLKPFILEAWDSKTHLVVFSCATAFFESFLFHHDFHFDEIIVIENPGLNASQRQQCTSAFVFCHKTTFVPGTLQDILHALSLIPLSKTCCLGLNINIFEPFHLFFDIMDKHPDMEYLFICHPYMGKYGFPRYLTTNALHLRERISAFGIVLSPTEFFETSGLNDEYLFTLGS